MVLISKTFKVIVAGNGHKAAGFSNAQLFQVTLEMKAL